MVSVPPNHLRGRKGPCSEIVFEKGNFPRVVLYFASEGSPGIHAMIKNVHDFPIISSEFLLHSLIPNINECSRCGTGLNWDAHSYIYLFIIFSSSC